MNNKSRVLEKYPNKVSQAYKKGYHNGIDIIGEVGSKGNTGASDYITAHSEGVISGIKTDYKGTNTNSRDYGNYVLIKHRNGYYTLYAHLKYGTVNHKLGDSVLKGERLGYMGATGRAFGVHLHFEVRNSKGEKLNPTAYINADLPGMEETSEAEKSENEYIIHVVQKGDTLWALGKKYGVNYLKIYEDNKALIDCENRSRGVAIDKKWLYPGQRITIKK